MFSVPDRPDVLKMSGLIRGRWDLTEPLLWEVSFSDSPSFKLICRRNDAHQEVVSKEIKGTVRLRGTSGKGGRRLSTGPLQQFLWAEVKLTPERRPTLMRPLVDRPDPKVLFFYF